MTIKVTKSETYEITVALNTHTIFIRGTKGSLLCDMVIRDDREQEYDSDAEPVEDVTILANAVDIIDAVRNLQNLSGYKAKR